MATKPMPVHGADISHHQASVDLAKAKKAGLRFLYHKATEGDTVTDSKYKSRRTLAKSAGIPFGAYHFARAERGDAAAEARRFLAFADPKPGDLRPALDLETDEGLSLSALRTWADTWCDVVAKAIGVQPVIYSPFDLGASQKGRLRWRARYNNDNRRPDLPWDIWQFSNGVLGVPDTFPGLGHVDLNTLREGVTVQDLLIPLPKPKTKRHRTGTYNAEFGHRPVKAWAKMILARFEGEKMDVLSINECQDYFAALKTLAEAKGHVLVGNGTNSRNALLVRKGLKVSGTGLMPTKVKVTTWFAPNGDAQSMAAAIKAKVDGVTYVSQHAPVQAWVAHPNGRHLDGPARRVQAYKDHTTNLVAFAEETKGPVHILGDWNAAPNTDGQYSPDWVRSQIHAVFFRPEASTGHGEIDFGIVRGATKVRKPEVIPHSKYLVPEATAKPPNPDHSDHLQIVGNTRFPE